MIGKGYRLTMTEERIGSRCAGCWYDRGSIKHCPGRGDAITGLECTHGQRSIWTLQPVKEPQ